MTSMQRTQQAWSRAHDALDAVCSELASVPGAGEEYEAMCKLVRAMQADGTALVEQSGGKFEKAR